MKRLAILGGLLVAAMYASSPAKADVATLFAGASFKEDSAYGYGGGVAALNGDLGKDGFLVRAIVGGGAYEYQSGAVTIDGKTLQVDGMVGYQLFLAPVRLSAYAGVNYQDHDLTPADPLNSTSGGQTGFKMQGELETMDASPLYVSAIGSYSTANDSYWARGRAGMGLFSTTVGPEIVFDGNDEYDAQRYGGFISVGLGIATLSFSAGWADVNGTQGEDSMYGTVGISTSF